MKYSNNNIDTGTMLNYYLAKNRVSKSKLGRAINRTGISILRYTENSSIQTGILIDICYALKHNFFQDIADRLPADFTVSKVPEEDKLLPTWQAEIAELKERIKILEAEKAILLEAFRK